MTTLNMILDEFKFKEGFICFGELSDESISEMERKLKITFPESYKIFLKRYGYVEWFGHSIYGYEEGYEEDYCNCTVKNTIKARMAHVPNDFEKIPQKGCVLENYGGGGSYILFSEESERSGQVALFLDELYGKEAQSWETFEEFLAYMISL